MQCYSDDFAAKTRLLASFVASWTGAQVRRDAAEADAAVEHMRQTVEELVQLKLVPEGVCWQLFDVALSVAALALCESFHVDDILQHRRDVEAARTPRPQEVSLPLWRSTEEVFHAAATEACAQEIGEEHAISTAREAFARCAAQLVRSSRQANVRSRYYLSPGVLRSSIARGRGAGSAPVESCKPESLRAKHPHGIFAEGLSLQAQEQVTLERMSAHNKLLNHDLWLDIFEPKVMTWAERALKFLHYLSEFVPLFCQSLQFVAQEGVRKLSEFRTEKMMWAVWYNSIKAPVALPECRQLLLSIKLLRPALIALRSSIQTLLGQEKTLTMQICLCYSVLTCIAMLACITVGGVSPRWDYHVESDIRHAGAAVLLIVPLTIMKFCVAISGASSLDIKDIVRSNGSQAPKPKLPGSHDAWLTVLEYVAKLVTGTYMYLFSGGVAHTDSLARDGARPVYLARFVQWSFAVPVLLLITNSTFVESRALVIRRSWPSLLAAYVFVWAVWLMEVTPHYAVRWPMVLLSLSGAFVIALDQFKLATECRATSLYGMKMGLLVYCKISELLYAVVFMLGRFGAIAPTSEHIFYAYSDAIIKVVHGAILAMIRNREGALEVRKWCAAAVAARSNRKGLLRSAKIPTLTIDLSGNIVQWNASIAQLTGLQEARVYGKPLLDFCPNDAREDLKRAVAEKVQRFRRGSSSICDDSGLVDFCIFTDVREAEEMQGVRRFSMKLVPKRSADGNLEGITAIGQDISEMVDIELVEERKNAVLAELDREIRSPFYDGMAALTSAVIENPEDKPAHSQLGTLKGCSALLLDSANRIMDLSRSETAKKVDGVPEVRPLAEVDLPSIVEDAFVMIENAVDEMNKPLLKPGVRLLNNSIGAKVPLIQGDPHKCTQLLYNLMTNAATFTARGSISVTFRHLPEDERLEIDVIDTGTGMFEACQKQLVSMFEQESSGDRMSYQGIGLGLVLCKEIVEFHRGSLRVQSVVGQGSTFTFSLPCEGNMGSVEVKGHRFTPREPEAEPQTDLFASKPFVLSVDNDDVNQEVIKSTIRDICEVAFTTNGDEALSFLDDLVASSRPFPDLILLDIQMPGMSSFEVCEHIRKRYDNTAATLPVTLLSAKAPLEAAPIQSVDSGGANFITKPFNPEILKTKVVAGLKLKLSGVRFSGVDVVMSEAYAYIKQHDDEIAKANQRAAAIEAELEVLRKQKDEAKVKVEALELEIKSAKNSSDSQVVEIFELSKECDKLQELLQSRTVLPAPASAQVLQQANASPPGTARTESTAGSSKYALAKQMAHRCDVGITTGKSFAVQLLLARLQTCNRTAKHCQQLLKCSVRPSVLRTIHADKTQLEDVSSEKARKILTLFTESTRMALSELQVLEQISSNSEDIVHSVTLHDNSAMLETSRALCIATSEATD
eukprot:TRINITY_DN7061_c2_g1_i1.p1 TRINITY_DN7061_c2_g1~~TRINITY_DN7061_c2_g1_i1.p1  ORF type:complete len:1414 (+),score=209.97 TRINITY_DN7061_c2_g1_i1:203-4444(+)